MEYNSIFAKICKLWNLIPFFAKICKNGIYGIVPLPNGFT